MPEYKNTLLKLNLKSLLEEYSGRNSLALKKRFPEHYMLISQQLSIYPKAAKKLPVFTSFGCFLTAKSYEQSSSEPLAEYKARLFGGDVLLDLTGGLGIDDIAFSNSYDSVISIDSDNTLNELVRANLIIMGISNITRINSTAEEFIKIKITASLVYIDADRRAAGRRSIKLEDSSPPVIIMMKRLFEIAPCVLLKISPLVDLTYLSKTLKNISDIRVISLDGEVKEILVLLKRNHIGLTMRHAVDISALRSDQFFESSGVSGEFPALNENGCYFYEPSASLIKAGLTEEYAIKNGLFMLSKKSVYLTSDKFVKEFFGRSFEVISKMDFGKSAVKSYLKQNNIFKANIAQRDFPVTVDELRKAFRISDGGNDYLFFTAGSNRKKLFYHCKKAQ